MSDTLRFITCGSVDDGKSTLIGRLLHDSRLVPADELASLHTDDGIDLTLLVDGLAAEREQGITIDVAYRYFRTAGRRFVVADTPGHEQYTRNMVTGASTADVAVILIDARKGLLPQSKRHSRLVALLGVRTVVVVVNKLDLVGYSREPFDAIRAEYLEFAETIGLSDVTFIPVSALHGDNVVEPGTSMPWYDGPTLMSYLEIVRPRPSETDRFRLPVQLVNRAEPGLRGLAGSVVGGSVRTGDPVQVLPSGTRSTVSRLIGPDGEVSSAQHGQAVTITLADEIDVSRGDLVCAAEEPATVASRVTATLIWMDSAPLDDGRRCQIKIGTRVVGATISPQERLRMNGIGRCTVEFDHPVAFDGYTANRDTGGFIVIDRLTHHTAGAGLIESAAADLHPFPVVVDKDTRARRNGHRPAVVWLTGLSAAGKSTIANLLEQRLHALGAHTYLLDGDSVRQGLNRDLGFDAAARVENVRRVAEVARLMVDAGLIVLVALISPFRTEREAARLRFADGEFCEVFVDVPLEVAERRDPKQLYRKARRGELRDFTGIDSPYEPPGNPELRVDTVELEPDQAVRLVLDHLRAVGVVG